MSDTMRVNYFFRQFLQAEDFITDQAYHREKVQSLARYLFTMGVVEGFAVTEATVRGDVGVAVSAGMALDTQGRQIVLEKSANIPLAKYKGETVKLIIQYKEHLLDNRDDETQRDFIQKVDGEYYTARVLERPGFAILPEKKALEDGMIILAQIRISTSGAIRSIDMDVRPLVRAKGVPEPKPITPSDPQLVDTINGDFTVKGDLRVDGVLKTVGQLTTAWFADNVTADVAIRSVGSWENIAGMTIDMGLERDAVVTCQYTINVQANRQPLEMPDDLPEAPVVQSLTPSVPAGEGLFLVNQTDTNAMVRSVARTRGNATVRGRVPPGDVVEVIEPSADEARSLVGKAGEWVKIRMRDGTEGWTSMSSYRVRATGDAQMISNDEQVATGRFVEYKVVAGDQLGQIVINQGLATGWSREAIDLVKKINNLSSDTIAVGQTLLLPRAIDDLQPLENDFLGVRLAVDGTGYAQSGTHHRPIGYTATPNIALTGQLTVALSAGEHTIQLQWYKGGTVLQSWSCATASLGEGDAEGFLSGRSLQAVAYYR